MIVTIADDFSGASEIAGIGWRYGLSTEVQLTFDIESNADLVVIDADTRSQGKIDAIEKINALAKELRNSGHEIALFKKVDSVFRGHIVDEINTLQKHFHFERVLLLPANPARGRKIISGHYLVNGIPLDQTVFASDPHFPASSSSVEQIISGHQTILSHEHLKQNDALPLGKLITGDTGSKEDIKNYINQTNNKDLCCGGAECFEAYLEKKGFVDKSSTNKRTFIWPPYTLIISGSTVKDQFDQHSNENLFPLLSLPGHWQGEQFILNPVEEATWHAEVLSYLRQHKVIAIAIDHEVKRIKGAGNFSAYFVGLINFISENIGRQNIHLAITGGATASDIIKNEALSFEVKQEIAPGVVTLLSKQSKELFTVKPGSYLWPSEFIKTLLTNE